MARENERVVFLAFENPDAEPGELEMLACARCRNKTYTARAYPEGFPELYCAACGIAVGRFGWAPPD